MAWTCEHIQFMQKISRAENEIFATDIECIGADFKIV